MSKILKKCQKNKFKRILNGIKIMSTILEFIKSGKISRTEVLKIMIESSRELIESKREIIKLQQQNMELQKKLNNKGRLIKLSVA